MHSALTRCMICFVKLFVCYLKWDPGFLKTNLNLYLTTIKFTLPFNFQYSKFVISLLSLVSFPHYYLAAIIVAPQTKLRRLL